MSNQPTEQEWNIGNTPLTTENIIVMHKKFWMKTQECAPEEMKEACKKYLAFLDKRWEEVK